MYKKNKLNVCLKKGFTLTELMVVVSIAVAMSVVVLFNYRGFEDKISLNTAKEAILVTLREAQVYGLSVMESGSGSGQFNYAYGVYFSLDDPTHYYLFVDKNANKIYDVGSGCGNSNSECIRQETLQNGVTLSAFCDNTTCPPNSSIRNLSISFLRPRPDAEMDFTDGAGNVWGTSQALTKIVLVSQQNQNKTLVIESPGQIYEQ